MVQLEREQGHWVMRQAALRPLHWGKAEEVC